MRRSRSAGAASIARAAGLVVLGLGCLRAPSVASAGAAPAAGGPTTGSAFELRDGAIADPARGFLYLMTPGGGIDAVAVATGEAAWHATGADRPLLLLDEGRLLAQGEPAQSGEMPLALLDLRSGETLAALAVPLPGDISARLDEQLMSVFEVRARREGGALLVAWRHTRREHKGLLADRVTSVQEALVRIDLALRRAEPVGTSTWPSPWSRELPEPVAEAAERSLERAEEAGGVLQADHVSPVWAGETVYSVMRLDPVQERTRVRRWDAAGTALPDVSVASPPGEVRIASADGRYLLASALADAEATTYRWSLFSLATGEREMQLRLPTSAAPFAVFGPTLVYEGRPYGHRVGDEWRTVPLRLVAADSGTGAERWTHAIRDTGYHGPNVPRP